MRHPYPVNRPGYFSGIVSLCLVLLLGSVVHAQVFVTVAGAGKTDGSSWGNAYPAKKLQPALRAAAPGMQFWISAGTYTPDVAVRDSYFVINSGVKVYGGFKGTETSLDQRNWTTNVTILSGDIGKKGDSTDNSAHVVVFWYVDSTSLLDGCTVTGGNAKADYGGGIYNSTAAGITAYSFPVIRHCSIVHNNATYGGGGIFSYAYAAGDIKMTIDSCTFEYDKCDSCAITKKGGGAILSDAINGPVYNNLVVTNSTFLYNSVDYYGGAILMNAESGTTLGTIKNCLFQYNTAYYAAELDGSGAALNFETFNNYGTYSNFNVLVDGCKFLDNASYSYGGAIYSGLSRVNAPVLTIQNSVFEGNSADNAAGIYNLAWGVNCKLFFYNDVFRYNTVGTGNFGAIQADATQYGTDSTYIVNCLFDRNRAMSIGNKADDNGHSYMYILNSTVYDDDVMAKTSSAQGIIYNGSQLSGVSDLSTVTMDIQNSIVYWPSVVTKAIDNDANSTTSIYSSMIKGCGSSGAGWNTVYGTDMGKNIDLYPVFSDTANFNLNLRCTSPCLDTGDNSYISSYALRGDLNGNNRIYNGRVDLGAYEFNAIPPHWVPVATEDTTFTFTFSLAGTGEEDSVEWSFGDGSSSHYYPAAHTYAAEGTYKVCLQVFSCEGGTDSCFNITVRKHTGIADAVTPACIIAPNPAANDVHISGLPARSVIEMYNCLGAKVYHVDVNQGAWHINTGSYTNGLYFISVTDVQYGGRQVYKLLVQH